MKKESSDAMQDKPDLFYPNPEIMCPISGEIIPVWMRDTENADDALVEAGRVFLEANDSKDHHQDRWFQKSAAKNENETQVSEHDFKSDFRIIAYSPGIGHENIRVTAHCFVSESKWNNTEICNVTNIESGQVYYNTDEESPEDILRRVLEKKKTEE